MSRYKHPYYLIAYALLLSMILAFFVGILPAAAYAEEVAGPAPSVSPEASPKSAPDAAILITEIMVKNHASVQDGYGEFPDWIELYNNSGEDLNLDGWSITDKASRDGLVFPAFLFPADSYFLVFASGKDKPEELQAPFSLSGGELILLRDPEGTVVVQLECPDLKADRSYALGEDGEYTECIYPTPWYENTTRSYDTLQSQFEFSSPILINEVMVSDPNARFSPYEGDDWVELRNTSAEPVDLSGWFLSDDDDDYRKAALPEITLEPGALTVVRCDQLGLSLNSDQEALFLWQDRNGLRDWIVLRDIPYGGSYGRVAGRNGSFFFSSSTPNEENKGGMRRVSVTPVATTPDGFFDGSEEVVLDLQADGKIYYTYDATMPNETSLAWAGPTAVPASCVIRAISVEPGALPSRPLTLNYFIGETFALPVLSLVSDDKVAFYGMYNTGWKDLEWSGNISWYEKGGSFSAPCGISMHGDTSLVMPKKNMSLRFRGSYGLEELNYDLFGGGVTSFTNLVIRAGQDQNACIIRNELCENLALAASDNIIGSRSRYCVLFLDGKYSGIYALSEKLNEQHYANLAGVSKNSVVTMDSEVPRNTDFFLEVFDFCAKNKMDDPENFAHLETLLDIDSMIDWVFLEGFFANKDLTFGNLRFCRSSEDDGRWRFMFYDLDATLAEAYQNHAILLHRNNIQCVQVSYLFADLWKNEEFQDRFLTRAAELLKGPLSNEKVLAEIDRLADQIAPEVSRDFSSRGRTLSSWEANMDALRTFITDNNWAKHNVDAICKQLHLSQEVRDKYFSDIE